MSSSALRQVTWTTLLGEAAAGASHVGSLAQKNLGCSLVFPRVLWKKHINNDGKTWKNNI